VRSVDGWSALPRCAGKAAGRLDGVRKTDLQSGDWVLVNTLNSLYSIYVLGDGTTVFRADGSIVREGPATIA